MGKLNVNDSTYDLDKYQKLYSDIKSQKPVIQEIKVNRTKSEIFDYYSTSTTCYFGIVSIDINTIPNYDPIFIGFTASDANILFGGYQYYSSSSTLTLYICLDKSELYTVSNNINITIKYVLVPVIK